MAEDPKPRTLKDDLRKELTEQLAALKTREVSGTAQPQEVPLLFPWEVDRAVEQLLPWLTDVIDHREQLARIDRGILPYDED